MKKEIEAEFRQNGLRNIQVEIFDETITLKGKCHTFFSKQIAQEIAMKFGKVKNNNIVVGTQSK